MRGWLPRRAALGGLALALLAPAACSDDEPGAGEARLEVDGVAIVERDGERDTVEGGTDLDPGDRVEITEGVGRLLLAEGVRMEMREGLGDADNSVLVMGERPVLEAGDLLVAAPERSGIEAAGTAVDIAAGAARVSRQLGVGVAAYDGLVHIDSAGQEREVPALREMQVPALGRPPRAPRPLTYDAEDPWDRRILGDAIALGERLEGLATNYTQNLSPGEGRTVGFFKLVLPGLEDETELDALLEPDRPTGETLIGAAIADLGRQGSFPARWSSVFGFRDQGAEWGLVALDQDVSGSPLLGTIEQAIASSPLGFVEGELASAPPGGPVSPPTQPPGSTPTTSPGSPTTSPTSPPRSSPTTTSPPPPSAPGPLDPLVPPDPSQPEEPPPLAPEVQPVVEPVTDLVGGIVDGLLGPSNP